MAVPNNLVRYLPLGLAYFVTAALAAALTRFNGGVAFLWVSNALLMAALMMQPRRQWRYPLVICGVASMLATGLFGFGWPLSLPFAAINMVEAVIAAWIFRRLGNPLQPLGSLSWTVVFTVSAGIVAPFAAAVLATTAVWTAGLPSETLLPFFAGHSLGNLTVAPLALLVARRSRRRGNLDLWKQRAAEGILLFAIVAVVTLMVFTQPQLPLLFLPILPIILVTFRLGRTGAAVAIVLLAVIGGGATLFGIGPIQMIGSQAARMQFFQFYLAATVLTVLPVAADLENRRRLHRNMRLSEQRYRLLAQHSSDILLHMDRNARIRYISPSIVMAGGQDPTKLIGEFSSLLVAPDHREKALADFRETLTARGQTRTFEYLAATVDGKQRWFETHSRAIIDDEGVIDGVMSVIRDVSARKANEQRLAEYAQTDPLTGLLNRRAFRTAIERRPNVAGERSTDCVAVLDIDHFKVINDNYGHAAGDEVLRGFARVARRMVREHDLVARIGGEEFAIFFPDTSVDVAMQTCERMRTEISQLSLHAGVAIVHVTVSGGVAALGPEGLDHCVMIADLAMYQAKRNGRDQLLIAA
jgi:diguanylate cyclase (GGDEF)-like protein/PAS domain S-box-containing protein